MLLQDPPDLLIDRSGRLAAVRLADGRLALAPWARDPWITDGWLQGAGQPEAAPWPAPGAADPDLACDPLGCVLVRAGQRVTLLRDANGLQADCAAADLVISYPRIEACRNGTPLIGPRRLAAMGGLTLWLSADGIRQLSVRAAQGARPWTAPEVARR
jgi:competence protein ComEC